VKSYSTANKKSVSPLENPVEIQFSLDDDVFTFFPPTAGQLAYLVAAQSDSRDASEQMAAIIDFVDGILDDDGREVLRRRLLDRNDPFDFDDIEKILEGLMEEWTTRPTMPSIASSTSPSTGGRRSTAKRPSRE
jgi:hypothetical protein